MAILTIQEKKRKNYAVRHSMQVASLMAKEPLFLTVEQLSHKAPSQLHICKMQHLCMGAKEEMHESISPSQEALAVMCGSHGIIAHFTLNGGGLLHGLCPVCMCCSAVMPCGTS